MTHVGDWFSSLDQGKRKQVLSALHCYRHFAERPSLMDVRIAEASWPHLIGLLLALERDHEELKPDGAGSRSEFMAGHGNP